MREEGRRIGRPTSLDDLRGRATTALWVGLIGGIGATMLCAVNFKSWRWGGTSGWSDGATRWVAWGLLGGGAVLGLLAFALAVDVGWLERFADPAPMVRLALAVAVLVSTMAARDARSHHRALEASLPPGWTLAPSWGLVTVPWAAGVTAVLAAILLALQHVGAHRTTRHRPADRPA